MRMPLGGRSRLPSGAVLTRSRPLVSSPPGRGGHDQFVPSPIAGHHLGPQGLTLVRRRLPGRPGAFPIAVANHVPI